MEFAGESQVPCIILWSNFQAGLPDSEKNASVLHRHKIKIINYEHASITTNTPLILGIEKLK